MHSFEEVDVWYILWLPEHIFNWCMLWEGGVGNEIEIYGFGHVGL